MINVTADDNAVDWNYQGNQQNYLLSLLTTSTFEGRLKESLESEINDIKNMDKETYDRIVFKLYSNQFDKVTHGCSYNMGDIIKHLRKLK